MMSPIDASSMVSDSRTEAALLAYLESANFLAASTNSSRLVSRLKSDVQGKQLYQVHQDLRNIYFRFSNYREKVGALKDLLYNGASYLLSSNELITGQDIAQLLLEISSKHLQNRLTDSANQIRAEAEIELATASSRFHEQKGTVSLDICRQVSSIAIQLPDTELGRQKYIAEALRVLGPKTLNRDLLHNTLAITFWQHKNLVDARFHFLHCASLENAEDVAALLVEHNRLGGTKSEVDLFIAQFTFQLLCLQSPIDSPKPLGGGSKQDTQVQPNLTVSRKSRATIRSIADKVFSNYALKHPSLSQVDIPFSSLPLLNFTQFIISLLDSQLPESNTFTLLCDIYKTVWSRDPNYQSYLNRIGILYFGLLDRQKQQQGGFFNNILMSLFEGTDEDDEDGGDEEEESSPSNNMSLCDELD